MSFDFGKFVKRSTRGIFIFIVVIMVLPLVLWGTMSQGPDEKDAQGNAGVIFETLSISRASWDRHHQRALAGWWWKKFNDPMTLYMWRYQKPAPPKPEELVKQAWEDLILLEDARMKGITATEQEVLIKVREIYQKLTGSFDIKEDILVQVANGLFHVPLTVFQAWAADLVVTDKLLDLVSESSFAEYARVYDQLLRRQQMAKVWYAAFDPKDCFRDVKPPRAEEIAAYYEKNKGKFKTPAKVQVAYLMADIEELKKKVAEPSEADVKKYYEDNKPEFSKTDGEHAHAPGEKHEENEPVQHKPFDEVKAGIPDKIRHRAAEKDAAAIMKRVDVELGEMGTAPDNAFDRLKAKFKIQGINLVYDITSRFDRKQVDDIEKIVGQNSGIEALAFDPAQKEGDISKKVKTSKGVALFRLTEKKDSYEAGVTDLARELIVKDLQKEQVKKRTQSLASTVVQEITTRGMALARRKRPLDWKLTRYFTVGGVDSGIEDSTLSQEISQKISSGELKAGKAVALSGSMMRNREKADWAYVLYLEDLVGATPDDVGGQFADSRRGLDEEARKRYREEYIAGRVAEAGIKLDPSFKKVP